MGCRFDAGNTELTVSGLSASIDYENIANPAFNQDRRPVSIDSIRLHSELGERLWACNQANAYEYARLN